MQAFANRLQIHTILNIEMIIYFSNTNGGIFRNEPQVQPQPFAHKITTQCPNIVVKREVANEMRTNEFHHNNQQQENAFRIPSVQIACNDVTPRFETRFPTVHETVTFNTPPLVTEEQQQQQLNINMANIESLAHQPAILITQQQQHHHQQGLITSGYSPEEPENNSPAYTCASTTHSEVIKDENGMTDSNKRKRGRGKKSSLGFPFANNGSGVYKYPAQSSPRKVNSTKTFQCPLCDFSTPYYSSLDVHTKSIHSVERPFSCVLCEYTCKLKGNLKKHYMGIHKLESEPASSLLKHSSAGEKGANSTYLSSQGGSGSNTDAASSNDDQSKTTKTEQETPTSTTQIQIDDQQHQFSVEVSRPTSGIVTYTSSQQQLQQLTSDQQSDHGESFVFQNVSSAAFSNNNRGSKLDFAMAPSLISPGNNNTAPTATNSSGVESSGSIAVTSSPQTIMTSLTSFDPAATNEQSDFPSVSAAEVPALLMPQGYTSIESFMPMRMESMEGIQMMGTLETHSDDESCGLIS